MTAQKTFPFAEPRRETLRADPLPTVVPDDSWKLCRVSGNQIYLSHEIGILGNCRRCGLDLREKLKQK